MEIIQNDKMPRSNGHYSMCISHNGTLYVAGQLPINRKDKSIPESIEAQTDLALANVEEVLIAAGADRNDVIQARVYISDIELWEKVNERYSLFFGDHKPVRCIVPTNELHYGSKVEIEVIAAQK